jgi:hypothetical protein
LEESYQTACKFRPPVTSHGKSTSGAGERFLSPINLTSGESEEHFYSLEEDDDILQVICHLLIPVLIVGKAGPPKCLDLIVS